MRTHGLGPSARRSLLAAVALACAAPACVDEVTVEEATPGSELGVHESRTVELQFLRFDVKSFEQTLTLDDLRDIPRPTLEEVWLLDLDMRPMVGNALSQITFMPPEDAYALPQAAKNLWSLLNMTPESAVLAGTSLESLLGVGNAVGFPTSRILADMVMTEENTRLISTDLTAQAVLADVVGTHPNAKKRKGPVTMEHPDGLYPVTPGTIPVSLYDVVSNFEELAERYGPAPLEPGDPPGAEHPGFITNAAGIKAAEDDFSMTVKVDINALPYKGIDATNADVGNINSTPSQINNIFDFSDPDWLKLHGLTQNLTIGELTMAIHEDPEYLPGGMSMEPVPLGDSAAWSAPPWEFEHLLADAGVLRAGSIPPHCTAYAPKGNVPDPFEAVEVCIDETGWTEIHVDPSVILDEPPPAPRYFWDILLEVAQARLHDGGLQEGEADLELTVKDVPVGVSTDDLVAQIRENVEKDPTGLTAMAIELNDTGVGDPDFYYYQPKSGAVAGKDDYLYFIAPGDIRKNEDGLHVRGYAYEHPGFYADAELSQKVSSTDPIDGDSEHEKVKIEPGSVVFIEDDVGHRYSIQAGDKPSPHRISLTITRTQ